MVDSADVASVPVDSRIDARVLHMLLHGQLSESSSISDGDATASPLSKHPRFSKVLDLARIIRSFGVLRNADWWMQREADWDQTLERAPLQKLFLDLSHEHRTGFLTLSDGERAKVIAVSSGSLVCANSNLVREQLASNLVLEAGLDQHQIDNANQLATERSESLAWAALQLELTTVTRLQEILQTLSRQRISDLFSWTQGVVRFHEDERASQLFNIVNRPLLELLREGTWSRSDNSIANLQTLCEPLLSSEEALKLQGDLGTLKYQLNQVEQRVLQVLAEPVKADTLAKGLEEAGPEVLLQGLQTIYVFFNAGLIQLEGVAEQPRLSMPDAIIFPRAAPSLDPQPPPSPFPKSDAPTDSAGSSELAQYRRHQRLEREGRRLLNSGHAAEAVERFEEIVNTKERPVDALALLSVATLLADKINATHKAQEYAQQAFDLDRSNALAQAAMSRAFAAAQKKGMAEQHRKGALRGAEHNTRRFNEVKGLLELGRLTKKSSGRNAQTSTDPSITISIVLIVFGVLFGFANLAGLGAREYFYDGQDIFFYARRVLLIVAGLLGIKVVTQASFLDIFKELGWKLETKLASLALLWGLMAGYFSPSQRVTGGIAVVIGLTLLHVLAEEIFFRGFITRAFWESLDPGPAIVGSGFVYGLYHLTYYSFWAESSLKAGLYWCALIGMFAGIPYAFFYQRSKSILPPLICHTAVNGVMMFFSLMRQV